MKFIKHRHYPSNIGQRVDEVWNVFPAVNNAVLIVLNAKRPITFPFAAPVRVLCAFLRTALVACHCCPHYYNPVWFRLKKALAAIGAQKLRFLAEQLGSLRVFLAPLRKRDGEEALGKLRRTMI